MHKLLRKITLLLLAFGLIACAREPTGAFITAADLAAQIAARDAPFILDVRSEKEYAGGHIPGAVNIPHTEIADRIDELEGQKNDMIVVLCRSGIRADTADEILVQNGFTKTVELAGHMNGWKDAGLPIE